MIFLFCPYPGSEMYKNLRTASRLPEPGDAYFHSLISTTDLSRAISFTERLSSWQLGAARLFGMALFYAVSFGLRPWRLAQTAYRMAVGRYETYLEDRLGSFLQRLFIRRWSRRSLGEAASATAAARAASLGH
jgi:hypothetical protein